MPSAPAPSLHVTLSELPDIATLAAQWRALEVRSEPSFFTSWTWIGTWLQHLPPHLRTRLLRVTRSGEVVSLALLTPGLQRRHGFVRSRALFLNATGEREFDNITIEYNGLLSERGSAPQVWQAVLAHLAQRVPEWDEIHLDLLAAPLPPVGLSELTETVQARRGCHVELDKVRANAGNYLALLKQSPRYSVRRSLKHYETLGDVTLDIARDEAEAQTFLAELQRLHAAYWNSRGLPGAFASSFALAFHRALVRAGLPRGEIQLLRLRAGTHTVALLYNFVHRGRVLNYQAGVDYSTAGPNSPGLAAHALAVQLNAREGHETYDFMAGDSLYKRQLATAETQQYSVVLRRDRLQFRLEDALRALRDRLCRRHLETA